MTEEGGETEEQMESSSHVILVLMLTSAMHKVNARLRFNPWTNIVLNCYYIYSRSDYIKRTCIYLHSQLYSSPDVRTYVHTYVHIIRL